MKNLPGYPDYDSVHSVIGFDPRGAGLDIGPVNAYATVQVRILSYSFHINDEIFNYSWH